MLNLFADGTKRVITLGKDILNGQQVQVVIPKGTWQGAVIEEPGKFALMGCTVAPAFDFEDFEMADRKQILDQYPNEHQLIEKLL
jgi:predicted cupin superfamily sugar epimerase